MRRFAIRGVGAVGPGFSNWTEAQGALRTGRFSWTKEAVQIPTPPILNPRERRRSSDTVRLALAVGLEACTAAGIEPAGLPAVFASSHGEGATTHRLMSALSDPDPLISPTLFHNSVHNTPAGYWSISVQSHQPTASISAGNATASAGLLKAANVVRDEAGPVLLVIYDAVFPDPLNRVCPIAAPLGVALVFGPVDGRSQYGSLGLSVSTEIPTKPGGLGEAQVEPMTAFNPIGEILAVLRRIASGEAGQVAMGSGDWAPLMVDYTP